MQESRNGNSSSIWYENQDITISGKRNSISYDKERFTSPTTYKTNVVFNRCHVTDKQAREIQRKANKSGFSVPPLKDVTSASSSMSVPKKRKLYKPDDFQ